MIAAFLSWWGQQLRSLLPARFAQPTALSADALVVTMPATCRDTPPSVALGLRRSGTVNPLGAFSLDPEGLRRAGQAASIARRPDLVVLQLGPDHLLEKRIDLPLAAEADLDRVLAFEMDRETPFTPDEIYWDAGVLTRDRRLGRLGVRLSLVPRASLRHLIEGLAGAGLAPKAIVATAAGGEMRTIALDHPAGRRQVGHDRTAVLLAILCGLLAIGAVALPFVRQARALAAADDLISALTPATRDAEAMRDRIAGAGADLIAAERARLGDPLAALASVTDALPDDSHLTDLSFKAHRLSVTGQSASAARLLSRLAGNPAFRDPRFTAPVTKVEGGAQEAFSIDADMR